ncbi:MAG: hypothetical protein FWH23_08125 [Bacteroidales bacterium]|nr:hypothetical protein [Bacteroidales bacterium]
MNKISKIDFWFLLIGVFFILVIMLIGSIFFGENGIALTLGAASVFLALLGLVYSVFSSKSLVKSQSKILENLSTRDISPFPENILEIIELMELCKEKNYLLNIYTDVPGYGIFSQNIYWHRYYDKITELGAIPVHWYYYSEKQLKTQRELQFAPWKNTKEEELKPYIDRFKKRVYRDKQCHNSCNLLDSEKCRNPMAKDKECYVFYHDLQYSYESVIECVAKLQNITNNIIRQLQIAGVITKIFRLDYELPFFAWIALNKETKQPVEGIISYNVYKEGMVEKGFRTNNSQLLKIFYDIIQANVSTQLRDQKLRESETDETSAV